MNTSTRLTLAAAAISLASATTLAGPSGGAYSIPWSTIDSGGVINASGGSYTLSGTIGQPDASNAMTGGSFTLTGGFWAGVNSAPPCPADLNGDGNLNFFDVSLFLSLYGAQDPQADFAADGSFNFFDVSAFLASYGAGCP